MSSQRVPSTTLALLLTAAGLHILVPFEPLLYFSAADIARGELWRLVTGHLVHADLEHLFWNALGLAILALLIERRSARLLWITFGAGVVSVDVLLLSPFSQLDYYCGLSGVLNALLVVALWLEWRTARSLLVVAVAVGSVLKVVIEISLGISVVTDISWPPYAWSHAAGLLGGLLVVCSQMRWPHAAGAARRQTGPAVNAPAQRTPYARGSSGWRGR